MSKVTDYTYQPLLPGCIRLLQLQPNSQTSGLSCDLITVSLDSNPLYEAISYVWGSPNRHIPISCQGSVLKITTNLLQVLQKVGDTQKPRTLWVDAICINQEDHEERENQVKIMAHIFASALRILAWVGQGDGAEQSAIDSILRLNRHFGELKQICGSLRDIPPIDCDEKPSAIGFDDQSWNSVEKMVKSPLFRRVWIIQELGLGRDVLLLYGNASIEWLQLVRFCSLVRWKARHLVRSSYLRASMVWDTYRLYAKSEDLINIFEDSCPQRLEFLDVLASSTHHLVSDQRDRIYAFLGHPSASAGGSLLVQPDYADANSASATFCEVAMRLIERSKSLEIFSTIEHEEQAHAASFRSWVPMWPKRLCLTLGLQRPPNYHAAPSQDEGITLDWTNKLLIVRGFVIDTITVSTMRLAWNHILLAQDEESKRASNGPDLFHEMNSILNESFTHNDDQFDELITTLTAGLRHYDPLLRKSTTIDQHRDDFTAYTSALNKESFSHSIDPYLSREMRTLLKATTHHGDALRFEEKLQPCKGRKLFRTTRGYFGLGPRALREGDICCILLGSRVPIVLRKVNTHYVLVGEAYLHGFMDGDVFEMEGSGRWILQSFELY